MSTERRVTLQVNEMIRRRTLVHEACVLGDFHGYVSANCAVALRSASVPFVDDAPFGAAYDFAVCAVGP